MARNRAIPNFLYGTLGLAVVGTAAYFAIRSIRARGLADGDEDTMMRLRRKTRSLGRTVKDSAQKVSREAVRGFEDTGDAITEVSQAGLGYAQQTRGTDRL